MASQMNGNANVYGNNAPTDSEFEDADEEEPMCTDDPDWTANNARNTSNKQAKVQNGKSHDTDTGAQGDGVWMDTKTEGEEEEEEEGEGKGQKKEEKGTRRGRRPAEDIKTFTDNTGTIYKPLGEYNLSLSTLSL